LASSQRRSRAGGPHGKRKVAVLGRNLQNRARNVLISSNDCWIRPSADIWRVGCIRDDARAMWAGRAMKMPPPPVFEHWRDLVRGPLPTISPQLHPTWSSRSVVPELDAGERNRNVSPASAAAAAPRSTERCTLTADELPVCSCPATRVSESNYRANSKVGQPLPSAPWPQASLDAGSGSPLGCWRRSLTGARSRKILTCPVNSGQ